MAHITQSQKDAINSLRAAGVSFVKIAQQTGIPKGTCKTLYYKDRPPSTPATRTKTGQFKTRSPAGRKPAGATAQSDRQRAAACRQRKRERMAQLAGDLGAGTDVELAALLVQAEGFGLVIADNASDTFGGDEINRRQVRAFMRALNRLATVGNCAILLLAHVDKSTSRNGKGAGGEAYSGSTAWHNSARSRLFMARSESGTLEIAHQKSNFGRMQAPLLLQWPDGGLPMLAEGVAADFSGLMAQAQGRNDDNAAAALLKLIAEFESRGQFAAPAPQARNNVHALLRSESAFKALGLTQDDTKRIVNQCQRAGWIAPLEYRTSDRKNRERWTVTEAGRAFAGLFAPTAPTAPT